MFFRFILSNFFSIYLAHGFTTIKCKPGLDRCYKLHFSKFTFKSHNFKGGGRETQALLQAAVFIEDAIEVKSYTFE